MTRFENPDGSSRFACTNTKAHRYANRYKRQKGLVHNPAGRNQHTTKVKPGTRPKPEPLKIPKNGMACKSCRASGKGLFGIGKCPKCKGRRWVPKPPPRPKDPPSSKKKGKKK